MRTAVLRAHLLRAAALSVLALSVHAQGNVAATDSAVTNSPAMKDFQKRVADYLKLHKTAKSEVHRLKPTTSAEEIAHHEHHLAKRIRELRGGVVPGNIFTPEIAAEIRRLIAITMQGPEGGRIHASLQRAAPVHLNALRVD